MDGRGWGARRSHRTQPSEIACLWGEGDGPVVTRPGWGAPWSEGIDAG